MPLCFQGSLFQQAVGKYLSTTTLESACPWLQGMVSVDVQSRADTGNEGFVYTPPLPNITSPDALHICTGNNPNMTSVMAQWLR